MKWLLDTNVLSEVRKGPRCNRNVSRWFSGQPAESMFTSVVVLGEIRIGVERLRRRDPQQAQLLEQWLGELRVLFGGRILDVTEAVADAWGRLNDPNPLPVADAFVAATARVHGLVVVTRNAADFAKTRVTVFDPFEA